MAACLYGIKKEGHSRFVIVAPHAAKPEADLYTGEISTSIAEALDAYLCVNNKFSRTKQDFNRLQCRGSEYGWTGRGEMQAFYADIQSFAEAIGDDAVVIFIHGMKNDGNWGVDIGAGWKYDGETLKGANCPDKHPQAGNNSGMIKLN